MKGKGGIPSFEKGLVSVIIPTYNYGKYLRQCIESALKQTYPKVEVIVVDDGSTDATSDIVADYNVKYIFQSNQGTSAAMNNGIRLSKGEFFLTLSGSDDMLGKQYVSKAMKEILSDNRIGLVYTGVANFGDRNGVVMPRKLYHRFSILVGGWVGIIGCALTRREAFESVEGFDSSLPAYEDLDLVPRLCLKGWKIKPVFEPIYFARRHQSELAHRHPHQLDKSKDEYAQSLIDQKFWYGRYYRQLLIVYNLVFERFFFMAQNPIGYLKGVNNMYRIMYNAKAYPWRSPSNRQKGIETAKMMASEIYEILSAQVARSLYSLNITSASWKN